MKLRALSLLFVFTSCCRLSDPAAIAVSEEVAARTGYEVYWERKAGEVACALISSEMTLEQTIQAALLRSPEIQLRFEKVGMAQADLVNACLLANPLVSILARIPSVPSPCLDLEIDALQPFVNILLQPLRKKSASLALAATKAQVADELFSFIERVGECYYRYVAARENLRIHEDLVEARFLASDVAEKQFAAGNVNLLTKNQLKIAYQEVTVSHKLMEIDLRALKEELNKLLGGPCEAWEVAAPLHPFSPICSDSLATYALEMRLDLYSIWLQTEALATSFGLYNWWTYTNLGVGSSYESDPKGGYAFGPGFGLSIPIFNYGQGDKMMVSAEFAASYQAYLSKRLEIIQDVNTYSEGYVKSLEQIALLEQGTLPMKEEMTREQVRLYNFMNAGVYDILEAKAQELIAKMEINDALCRAGVYRLKLERAVGGALP